MSEQKRASTRYECLLDVEMDLGAGFTGALCKNISLGGMYVETASRPALGTRVKIKFHIPTQKEAIETGATVRWTDGAGFGVQFDGLRAREVWALGKFFEQPA